MVAETLCFGARSFSARGFSAQLRCCNTRVSFTSITAISHHHFFHRLPFSPSKMATIMKKSVIRTCASCIRPVASSARTIRVYASPPQSTAGQAAPQSSTAEAEVIPEKPVEMQKIVTINPFTPPQVP